MSKKKAKNEFATATTLETNELQQLQILLSQIENINLKMQMSQIQGEKQLENLNTSLQEANDTINVKYELTVGKDTIDPTTGEISRDINSK
ncbi:MAG: hypothetical protein GY861_24605 [bacterium]|nr:hypothetical protein [bacterium]